MLLEHEGGKGVVWKDNKFVVFNKAGDVLGSGSTRSLGNAVKDACTIIRLDWAHVEEATSAAGARNDSTRPPVAKLPLHLIAQLRSARAKDRWRAARALGNERVAGEAAVPALIFALSNDEDWEVRAEAAASLGRQGGKAVQGVGPLLEALNDEDGTVRRRAAAAIVSIGPAAVPTLEAAIKESHETTGEQANRLLEAIAQKYGRSR